MTIGIALAERGVVPDWLLSLGIDQLLEKRLERETLASRGDIEALHGRMKTNLGAEPIALVPEVANDQHYEVPPSFFELVLGPHRKYSSCFFDAGTKSLKEAEERMLALTTARAEIDNGMSVLELGCGWGSLTLWMAEQLPQSKITAVSNSSLQRDYILKTAAARSLGNIEVITADMNVFAPNDRYDRIVSVEMFEHMRNYQELLNRISSWLRPDGRLFVHIFCHRCFPYEFRVEGKWDWMSEFFFTGGLMPSERLLSEFDDHLVVEKHWRINGDHYAKTALAWLENMDNNKQEVLRILKAHYGDRSGSLWFSRWRMFFLACARLFGYRDGREWFVAHYLFRARQGTGRGLPG